MIYKLLSLLCALLLLNACHRSADITKEAEKNTGVAEAPVNKELTPFMISEVTLYDTNDIKTVGRGIVTNGEWHPSETTIGYNGAYAQMSPKQMQALIQNLVHGKAARVYLDIDSNRLSPAEVFTFANCCDSIIEFDDKGHEKSRHFVCDSTTMYMGVQKIVFYETWNLNPDNGAVSKDVLGYTLCQKLYGGEGFKGKDRYRAVLHAFKDEASLEKAKQYLVVKNTPDASR